MPRQTDPPRDPGPAKGALVVRHLARAGLTVPPFAVEPGEAVALLGPSGSGKTLLLRAIADLDPNEGDLRLGETAREETSAPAWRRQVTYVATQPGWWAAQVAQHFPPEMRAAAADLLERLKLSPEAMGWPVTRLSSGEAQRVGLARAFLNDPPALLLDEPTSALDAEATEAVERLLRERLNAGLVLLFATHDPAQARRLAGRTLRLAPGGTVREERL